MVLTLIFALGLPLWLVIEQIARLRSAPAGAPHARETTPARAAGARKFLKAPLARGV